MTHARILLRADAFKAAPGWADAVILRRAAGERAGCRAARQRSVEGGPQAALLSKPSAQVYARKLETGRGRRV